MVTFIDERKKMRIPQRIKPRESEEPKQKKANFKGVGNLTLSYPCWKGSRTQTECMG